MSDTLAKQLEGSGEKTLTLNRIILGVALSALSGLFFYLAFPPISLWPFIFVAITPYLILKAGGVV